MKRINGKVIGDSIATPMPVPDWNQTNPNKADYIKNKPNVAYEVECTPSPSEWFTFVLRLDEKSYSVKANFANNDTEKTEIVIPYEYKGLPVVSIFDGGFADKANITKIIMPNSITSASSKAFQNCTSLQEVVLSKNIKILTDSMFENCTSLVQIDLPDSIKEIQYDVFRKTSIEYMNLPYGIKYIGETLFSENTKLKRVHIPDTVTRIDARAFYKCTGLEEIVIPNSVVEISYNTFTGCKGLKRAVIGTGIKTMTASDFMYCDNLETVVIPKTVTNIAKDVFWNSSYKPNPNVVLYVEQGSYAEEYAKQYKMKYVYSDISELPKQINPDYNQNDATQPDYIKNRPFYSSGETLLCTNEAITNFDNNLRSEGAITMPAYDYQIGDIIKIVTGWNGQISSGTSVTNGIVELVDEGLPVVVFEDSNVFSTILPGMISFAVSSGAPTNFRFKTYHERRTFIDEKFIPESIARRAYVEELLTNIAQKNNLII